MWREKEGRNALKQRKETVKKSTIIISASANSQQWRSMSIEIRGKLQTILHHSSTFTISRQLFGSHHFHFLNPFSIMNLHFPPLDFPHFSSFRHLFQRICSLRDCFRFNSVSKNLTPGQIHFNARVFKLDFIVVMSIDRFPNYPDRRLIDTIDSLIH